MKWTDSIPFYVTRMTADEYIYTYSISAWISIFGFMLAWFNLWVWSIVGLIVGVQTLGAVT